MKKNLFMLMLTVLVLASCDDDCDHKDVPPPPPEEWICEGPGDIGIWYEEEENEEMRYSKS